MKKIYLIQADGGPIKIGVTKNVGARFSGIQTATYVPLKLLGIIDGDEKTERRLHKQFSGAHIRGEWFNPSPELLAFVASIPPAEGPAVRTKGFSLSDDDNAKRIWFDMSILTDKEAAALIGRDRSTIKNHLGRSGRSDDPSRGMTPERAKELGRKGGLKSAPTNSKDAPLPLVQIQQIMDDHVTYPTVHHAITAINKGKRGNARISLNTIYRWNRGGKFKPPLRPRPTGAIRNRKS